MDSAERIAAVVLAAGASQRLGTPKQLALLGNETLLERAVRVGREAGCGPVIVVLGGEHERVLRSCNLGDVVPVIHHQWEDGMASSIRLGVCACEAASQELAGLIVMTCDQPAVTAVHLRQLMMGRRELKASRYAGRKGVPAFFPRRCFGELKRLKGEVGARDLLGSAETVALENGDLDVDTVQDLERAREIFGG